MRFVGLNLLAYSTEESIRRLFARFWNIAYLLDVVVILSQHPIKLLFLLWKIMMMLIDKSYLVNLRSYFSYSISSLDLFRYQNIKTFYGSISHWFKHQRILSNSSNSLILLFHFTTPSDKELSVKEWKTNINMFLRDMRFKKISTIYLTEDLRLLHVTYVYICINEDFLFMFEAVIEW